MSKPKKRELSKNKSCQSLGFLRPGLKSADLGDKEPSAPLGAGHKLLEGSLSDIALGGLSPRDFNDDVYERIMQEDYEKQPAIIYSLLDNATSIVKKYLTEYKNNKEGRKTLLNCFYLKCERVINCLALRLNDNSRLSEQDASVYLKEFTAFINRIKRWMDSILQKGIFDNLEYQQLRSIREGLIARLFVYEQKADLASTKPTETRQNAKRIIAALLISFIMILLFELFIHLRPVTWIVNHPRSYGIQGSVIGLIPCLIFGFFKPGWRGLCWGSAAIALIVGLLSLL